MAKHFYITTTLPYVNAEPHIGFALEIIEADVLARFKKLQGWDVFFNFGTDEHGLKIYRKAQEAGKDPQKYCDEYAEKFDRLKAALNLSYNNFIRTTDQRHVEAAQKFWNICLKNGDIYKKKYSAKYCVGCELEKTDSELEQGRCPFHLTAELEIHNEENYFFRFSKYQPQLLKLYEKKNFLLPAEKLHEIKAFVERGLEDFSISRLKKKMPWGIDVPNDSGQVIYVWFDALINYVSAIGWPQKKKEFEQWWPVVQVAGKDNLRQQSAIWQAMLLSAGLPPSKQIFIHGFLTANGQKISKSLGNTVDPIVIAKTYSVDALRYFLLREIPFGKDGDFSEKALIIRYNTELANDLGNLVSRVLTLAERKGKIIQKAAIDKNLTGKLAVKEIEKNIEQLELHSALQHIWKFIAEVNKLITESKPWEMEEEQAKKQLYTLLESLRVIAILVSPFLPETATKINQQLGIKDGFWKELKFGLIKKYKTKKGEVLFKKIEEPKEKPFRKIETLKQEKLSLVKEGLVKEGLVKKEIFPLVKEEIFPLQLAVGYVEEVKDHSNADSLFVFKIDFGSLGRRQAVTSLKKFLPKTAFEHKKLVFCLNLKPAKFRGEESKAMIIAAEDNGKIVPLEMKNSLLGELVVPEGMKNSAEIIEFKDFETVNLVVNKERVLFNGKKLKTAAEVVVVKGVSDKAKVK